MLCWFDFESADSGFKNDTAKMVLSTAFDMLASIKMFDQVALKISITCGNARRIVVGDENIQKFDCLVGDTVARTQIGDHLAGENEVLVDESTTGLLGNQITISEWRKDDSSNVRFAVIGDFSDNTKFPEKTETYRSTAITLPDENVLKQWVHPSVYPLVTSTQPYLMNELRPCAVLFIRFTGIDFNAETVKIEFDAIIQRIQRIAQIYEGMLMDISVGDKGSFAYLNFGADKVHEDDARRAVKAALEIRNLIQSPLQMGITEGVLRVGAYGGKTRKTFGAMGDDVNLAARLMTTADENEILLSSHVYGSVSKYFTFEPRQPLKMKGKAEPLSIFAVTGEKHARAVRLQEPDYSLPMVGREQELDLIEEKLDLAMTGSGQVIGILAEAGLGKSRLVAEVIRAARRKGFSGFGGACQSDSINSPYQPWKTIWQAFFDVDPDSPQRKQIRWLEGEIEDRSPSRVNALPLLGEVLNLEFPENDFTKKLEPKDRQNVLHVLLEECLKSLAEEEPVLIVIEDLHWIDALSYKLLQSLARALSSHAVCFVLAYRPQEAKRRLSNHIEDIPGFTRIELHELTQAEAENVIRAKMTQLYPARGGKLPPGLVETLMERAQGHPFYLEELLNYVRDRGLDPADIENIELPVSLHTLILSRIDQLSDQQRNTLQVASIVGRLFRARWLSGYYPELGSFSRLRAVLNTLDSLDITPLDSTEPELKYLFRHIVTHEVTYESLSHSSRVQLHEQLAKYLEKEAASVEIIAFHYSRSENIEKQREYLFKAGEEAQKKYANDDALSYYTMLLPLLAEKKALAEIYLKRGEVAEVTGKWDDAESDYQKALNLTQEDQPFKAKVTLAMGKLNLVRSNYEHAHDWLAKAKQMFITLQDDAGLAQVLIDIGDVYQNQGFYDKARPPIEEGLELAQSLNNSNKTATALNIYGNLERYLGNYADARTFYEKSLEILVDADDKPGIAALTNNLGTLAYYRGEYSLTKDLWEQSQSLNMEIGDKRAIAMGLNNLAILANQQGDFETSGHMESLKIRRELDDTAGIRYSLNNLGTVKMALGELEQAKDFFEEGLENARESGEQWGISYGMGNLGLIALLMGDSSRAREMLEEALEICTEMGSKELISSALLGLGRVDLTENLNTDAQMRFLESLRLCSEAGDKMQQTSSIVAMAGLKHQQGDALEAVQLLGSVDAALQTLKAALMPEMIVFHSEMLEELKLVLDDREFKTAWEEGRQRTLEETTHKVLVEQAVEPVI